MHDILARGGVSARTLRSNRERLRDELRACVLRGSQMPVGSLSKVGNADVEVDEGGGGGPLVVGNWEREAAVMVGAVVGALR